MVPTLPKPPPWRIVAALGKVMTSTGATPILIAAKGAR
jgi:hypothetical protein